MNIVESSLPLDTQDAVALREGELVVVVFALSLHERLVNALRLLLIDAISNDAPCAGVSIPRGHAELLVGEAA